MYLIDGNNLIGHTRDIPYHDPQARQKLLDRLMPFLEEKQRKAVVVFDGPPQALQKNRWIQLAFAGHGAKADDRIRRMVELARNPKELCVISSDNSIYSYSRNCGAPALKCHEFNRLLQQAPPRRAKPEKQEKGDLPAGDLKHWLRYFGEEE